MPTTIKRTALTQYGLRILRNSKLELEWEQKADMLSTFSERIYLFIIVRQRITPAASTFKAVLLYSGLSHLENCHSVPTHLLSPSHHALYELY